MASDDYNFHPVIHTRHHRTPRVGTLKRMMKKIKIAGDHNGPPSPLDSSLTEIQYSRGLTNPTGENNCFVNSAVQVLWHLDMFRRNFKSVDGHACMGDACIFCALKVLFTQFQYSDKESLPPDALRKALAISFTKEKRFQLRSMDDAAECFENILLQIHFCLTNNLEDTECSAKHCIPHNKFAMTILSQSRCECGATSEPFLYKEFVRYISSVSLCTEVKNLENWHHSASFGEVLQIAAAEKKECPSKCGKTAEVRYDLMNSPDVVTIGLIWDCDPSPQHIAEVIRTIKGSVEIKDMYSNVFEVGSDEGVYELVGFIAYYGKHYCTFFHHSRMDQWLYLEDTTVKKLGPSWHKVADLCIKSRYQPSLLFYSNPKWTCVDSSGAPSETILLPGYERTCKSPGVDNWPAAADYWPMRKIAECDEKVGVPTDGGNNPGVVEIGQAAMGLVQDPYGSTPAATEDRRNNNREPVPLWPRPNQSQVASDDANKRTTTSVPSEGLGGGGSNSGSEGQSKQQSSAENSHLMRRNEPERNEGSSSNQMEGDRVTSGDTRGGIDPGTWEMLYDQQKQEQEKTMESSSSKLTIEPLDSFDMALFSRKEAEPPPKPGAKSLFSLIDTEATDGGFELYHNDAFIDSADIPQALSHSGAPPQGVPLAGDPGRTVRADTRTPNRSIPPRGPSNPVNGYPAASREVMGNGPKQPGPLDRDTGNLFASQGRSSSGIDHGHSSPGRPVPAPRPTPIDRRSPSPKAHSTRGYPSQTSSQVRSNPEVERSGNYPEEPDPARGPPSDLPGYQGYHPGHRGAPFWSAPDHSSRTRSRVEGDHSGAVSEGVASAANESGALGHRTDPRGEVGHKQLERGRDQMDRGRDQMDSGRDQMESKTSAGRARLPLMGPHFEPGMNEKPPRRNDGSWTSVEIGGDLGQLWAEGKQWLVASKEAEDSGDLAVARSSILTAAAKFKMLLQKMPNHPQAEIIERLYRKANAKCQYLEKSQREEEERQHEEVMRSRRDYSRSNSLGYQEDVVQEDRFLQEAVNSTRNDLRYHHPSNYIPVTHWRDMTHTVRQVPIIVEGRHGNNRQGDYGGSIAHTREVPVRVYSTVPRQDKSRPFFVTANTMRR